MPSGKTNTNLTNAKSSKQDEFYTLIEDVEDEMQHYTHHLKGARVFSNCDTESSSFVRYFTGRYDSLGLRCYNHSSEDFRSHLSTEILLESDIVITNPPFSLFRQFIGQMMVYDKKFLILGNLNAVRYKEIWPLIQKGIVWFGCCNGTKYYQVPDDYEGKVHFTKDGINYKKLGNTFWFTNLSHSKRNRHLVLTKSYYANKDDYPEYDNYNAINVDNVLDIPFDYKGTMGVPLTFLTYYDPDQFEILGADRDVLWGNLPWSLYIKKGWQGKITEGIVKGAKKYSRILIKRK
ncbi:MAG: hypothetical protein ISN29_00065 [Gammaproteobacteria bacterium AqS3]|nr:hypothetical protein [Gammaproteobacteria bacterium AqS3]